MEPSEDTLIQELAKNKGKTVFIGARSSFFFIGPAEEAITQLAIISAMIKHIALMSSRKKRKISVSPEDGVRLGKRKVIKTYKHHVCDSTVILVSGREFGAFWTREEYLKERKKLLEMLSISI